MDTTFADEYKSSLNDLNFNSKPLINMLTMLADENKKHAGLIVSTIVDHIISTSLESKLPGLYLVDSIIKNLGDQYLKIFCQHIVGLFTSVFEKVDENTRSLMFKLRQTWTDFLPNKVLYNLDLSVEKLDPAWPVTAKNPSKKILINPKFLEGATEEAKAAAVAPVPNVPITTIKNEEDNIKQKQGEVLKQLLAKQEQLRQLEIVNLKRTMKKKSSMMGSTSFSASSNTFKLNPVWDPRMVKINTVPQHPEVKAEAISLPQGKSASAHVTAASSSALPDSKKGAPQIKPQSKFNSSYSKNNISAQKNQESRTATDFSLASTSPKKLGQKNKNDKSSSFKSKFSPVRTDKSHVELKPITQESSSKSPKKENSSSKDESNLSKAREKTTKSSAKSLKTSPKKRTSFENTNKGFHQNMSHAKTGTAKHEHKRKPPLQRIPKKSDRLKSANTDLATNVINEVPIQNLPLNESSSISAHRANKDTDSVLTSNQPANSSIEVDKTSQSAKVSTLGDKTNDSFKSMLEENVDSSKIDINSISKKDEDLRILPLPSKVETTIEVPNPDHDVSDQSFDKNNRSDSRKKEKTEDIENLNPEYRKSLSPLLFGSQDQDLRNPDPNLKDWSSYKATHPDEYSPSPRHENYEGRFRFRRHQFSDSKYYYPQDHDRYGPIRHPRGRYFPRRGRPPFMRGGRGKLFHPMFPSAPDASFMLDSLQLAEEKFRCGKISEAAYMDIRDELQKAMQSITYNRSKTRFSNFQDQGHQENFFNQQGIKQDYYFKQHVLPDNIKIQQSSAVPPDKKPFFLDGKERVVHFVEDRALVILDNNEPRELTFRDEQRNVFIDGIAEPLTLGFDGKSVEFAVDGKRHILRLGIPGREIYINNHPYEAHFGGPPIAVMLEDGCIYKMRLNGPPPQVIIGSTPQYELFSKYHGNLNKTTFVQVPSHNEEQKCPAEHSTPSSGAFLQDVDMRLPINIDQSGALLTKDSPFYIQDMKDVDWRQVPPSIISNPEKNAPDVFKENAPDVFKETISKDFETWQNEDRDNQIAFRPIRNDQNLLSESTHYEWKKSAPYHQPIKQEENTDPTVRSNRDNWYNDQQAKLQWRNNEYKQDSHPAHPEKRPRYEDTRDVKQNEYFESYESRNNQFQTYMPHTRRPAYSRIRGRGVNDRGRGSWVPNIERGPSRLDPVHSEPASKNFPTQPPRPRALLPSPPYPPEFPKVNPYSLPSTDVSMVPVETNDESSSGFPYEPVSSKFEVKSTEPANPDLSVDVNSLLAKLVAAGIINTKPFELPVTESSEVTVVSETPDAVNKKDDDPPVEEIPKIEFTPESLREHHSGVISALHKGLQCATCGMRFKEIQGEHYSRHLDWHFRMNRREKDGAKKAISRRWNYELEDWIQFEEFEDFEERIPSFFELESDNQQAEVPEVPIVISVPATSNDEEACPVCSERFQLFWVEDEEEWHFRDAVRHDDITYHPACYEDFKKAAEAEKNIKEEKSAEEETVAVSENVTESEKDDEHLENCVKHEVEEDDIVSLLHTLLHDVCENMGIEITKVNEEVPSETQLEEEILEGKPGEEEIIGVISESDMDVDSDIPKTESKMVVMQSGGITLKVKAESLQCHSPSNPSEKDTKPEEEKAVEDDEIIFRPPTPDPSFDVRPPVSRGRELSGLCCIM